MPSRHIKVSSLLSPRGQAATNWNGVTRCHGELVVGLHLRTGKRGRNVNVTQTYAGEGLRGSITPHGRKRTGQKAGRSSEKKKTPPDKQGDSGSGRLSLRAYKRKGFTRRYAQSGQRP